MHPAFSAGSLAETASGYYKAEVIRGPARSMPWKTVEDVELATLGWVHWHNTPAAARLPRRRPTHRVQIAFHATHGTYQHLVESNDQNLWMALGGVT